MLNSEDKKYLKDTVEKKIDDLSKKVDKGTKGAATNPNTNVGKKLNDLYKQDQEKEDRKRYIEELQKKNDKGEATLAEKVELFSQQFKKAIPPDLADTLKETQSIMKSGGKQALGGLAHLNERLMMSNPLTAMLWQNRDIFKAVGDVGIGGLKAGFGLVKGVGQGVAGILNSAVNLFKKKPKKETEEDTKPKQFEETDIIPEGKSLKEQETLEDTISEKISEIHDWLFKKYPKQKSEENELEKEYQKLISKGLGGLNIAMKSMNKFVSDILSKKKLILNGVMLGALALLGLAAWFKSSKLRDIVSSAVQGSIPAIIDAIKKNVVDSADQAAQSINLNKNGVETTQNKLDSLYGDVSSGMLQPKSEMDYANAILDKDNNTSIKTQSYKRPENVALNTFYDSFHKSGVVSKKGMNLIKHYGLGQDLNKAVNVTTYNNTKGGTKLAFPVKIKILEVELSGDKEHGMDVLIEKAEVNKIKELGGKISNLGRQVRILVTNVKKLYVPLKTVIPANTTIALIGAYGRIIGPLEEFMKGESFDEYTNKNTIDSSTIDENFVKFRNKKGIDKAYDESYNNLSKKFTTESERAKLLNNPYKWWKDNGDALKETYLGSDDINKYAENEFDKASAPTVNIPNNNTNLKNKTDDKVTTQKEILNQQDTQINKPQNDITSSKGVNNTPSNISINASNSEAVLPSNYMRPDVANVAQDNYLSCMNGGG